MPWMIEAAAIMSILVRDWVDFAIIMVLLLFNAVLGFWHERQAAQRAGRLQERAGQEAQALRDGKWVTVLAKTLVPGDIVRIRLGNVVPADVRLSRAITSMWTSRRSPANRSRSAKRPGDSAYSGSIAKKGEMTAVGHRHRLAHVFRPHGRTGAKRGGPLALCRRRTTGSATSSSCSRYSWRSSWSPSAAPPRRELLSHRRVRVPAPRGRDPGRDAGGALDDDGHGRQGPRTRKGDRLAPRIDRGAGRHRNPVL